MVFSPVYLQSSHKQHPGAIFPQLRGVTEAKHLGGLVYSDVVVYSGVVVNSGVLVCV